MKHLRLICSFLVVFLSTIAFADTVQEVFIPARYTKVIADRDMYLGMNLSPAENIVGIFRRPDAWERFQAVVQENGFRHYRFHYQEVNQWNVPLERWQLDPLAKEYYSKKPYKDIIGVKEFIKDIHGRGLRAGIQLNVKLYFNPADGRLYELTRHPEFLADAARNQAELVRWVNEHGYTDSVLYYELGNEDYHWATPVQMATIDAAFIREIRRVDPTAKISIDGQSPSHSRQLKMPHWQATVGEWHRAFLKALKDAGIKDGDFDYLSQHAYSAWIDNIPFNYPAEQPPTVEQVWKELKDPLVTSIGSIEDNASLLHSLGFDSVRIQVNEFKRGASRIWYQRTIMSALCQTDPWFHFVRSPYVAGATIHDAMNNSASDFIANPWKHPRGWGIIIPAPDNTFIASAPAVLFQLFAKFLANGDRILNTTSNFGAVAAYSNNRLKVILVNKEAEPRTVLLRADDFGAAKAVTCVRTELGADALDVFPVHPITKARHEYRSVSTTDTIAPNAPLRFTLPKFSVTLLEFTGLQPKIPLTPDVFKPSSTTRTTQADAMDYYENSGKGLTSDEKTILHLKFAGINRAKLQQQLPKTAQTTGIEDADFAADGLVFRGKTRIRIRDLTLPKDHFTIQVLMKADDDLDSAMAVASDFHFNGLGIWGGKLYSSVKTDKGRERIWVDGAYPVGKWLLFTVSYDGTTMRTFLNSELIGEKKLTGSVTQAPIEIGGAGFKHDSDFRGRISEVMISK